jgi:hypothetical protein
VLLTYLRGGDIEKEIERAEKGIRDEFAFYSIPFPDKNELRRRDDTKYIQQLERVALNAHVQTQEEIGEEEERMEDLPTSLMFVFIFFSFLFFSFFVFCFFCFVFLFLFMF